jgi:hypothetical protein
MVSFRHGTAVNSIVKGSGINEYSVRRKDGKKWIAIRPQREYSRLEHSVRKRGFEMVPEVLFNRRQATATLDDDGVIWYTDFVEEDELYYRTLHDPDWFLRNLQERSEVIEECKNFVRLLKDEIENGDIGKEETINYLKKWENLNAKIFPYMFLALLTDEILIQDFQDLLTDYVDTSKATDILSDLLVSEYSKNAAKSGNVPNKSKTFEFPPEPMYVPEGSIEFNRVSSHDEIILSSIMESDPLEYWSSIDTYMRYRIMVPLVFQVSEENFYVMRALSIAMNHIVHDAGEHLIGEGIIDDRTEMLEKDINGLVQSIEQVSFQ